MAPISMLPYPLERTHSPISAGVVAAQQALIDATPNVNDRAFAVIGDSISASQHFIDQFGGWLCYTDIPDDFVDEFARVIVHFSDLAWPAVSQVLRRTSWGRKAVSLVSKTGWKAHMALQGGSPNYLEQELATCAVDNWLYPRFALLMYGTNDNDPLDPDAIYVYAQSMWTIIQTCLDRGTIPIVYTPPPITVSAAKGADVPLHGAVVRGLCSGAQIPLIDYDREMHELPALGLSSDGYHPSAYSAITPPETSVRYLGCNLSEAALQYGFNLRNFLTLQALSRALRFFFDGEMPEAAPELTGTGGIDDPWLIPEVPFSMMASGNRHWRLDGVTANEVRLFDLDASAASIATYTPDVEYIDGDSRLLVGGLEDWSLIETAQSKVGNYLLTVREA